MNTYNENPVWRLEHDYCLVESGCSAEYKLGVQHQRLLAEEESNEAKTIFKDKCRGPTR